MRTQAAAVGAAVAFTLVACQQGDQYSAAAARAEREATQAYLTNLNDRLRAVEAESRTSAARKSSAYLTPADDGFAVIKHDLGSLAVQLENVRPYANGSKVKLSIANMASGALAKVAADIDWGPVGEDGLPVVDLQKTKHAEFNQTFLPGRWTGVEVTLADVPPEKLGFVAIRNLATPSVRMLN